MFYTVNRIFISRLMFGVLLIRFGAKQQLYSYPQRQVLLLVYLVSYCNLTLLLHITEVLFNKSDTFNWVLLYKYGVSSIDSHIRIIHLAVFLNTYICRNQAEFYLVLSI